ncbi:MAG: DUF2232 domain-containing protein [Gammaproteobacteria bacterium]
MRGRMQAVMVASALALLSLRVPPFSVFSSAAVALITLRKGANEGLLVVLVSMLAASALGAMLFGGFQFALIYGLALWLPIWLVSILLRVGRSLSLVTEVVVLIGSVGVIGYYLFASDPSALWKEVLRNMLEPMIASAPEGVPVDEMRESADLIAHYMTGIMAAGSVAGLLLGLLLARWWQALLYNPGGFRREFLSLRTQRPFAVGTLVVLAVGLAGSGTISETAWNVMIPLFVLYTLIGTAVFHVLLAARKSGRYLLPLFYVILFVLPQSLAPVALIGLSDTWLNVRQKFLNQTDV